MKNDISKFKIIFMGTPDFGAVILDGLIKASFRPLLVITAPDKLVGRRQVLTPSPVKVIAQKYKIPVTQPEKILNLKSEILSRTETKFLVRGLNLKPDLIVVAAYGQILPKEILEIPKHGCLNVHPSLLPRWRGPSPIQYAILNGDKKTGITIILMDEKIDHGPILAQRELEILNSKSEIRNKSQILNSKITYKKLHDKLAELGAELLIETIPKWTNGEIKPKPQNESRATYTKILTKEDGKINWKKSAEEIENQIRAFDFWPESFTDWQKADKSPHQKFGGGGKLLRIKILKARTLKAASGVAYPIGKTLVVPQNEIAVQCGKDFLVIERLQLEGRKEMSSEEFIRGYLDFIGTILK